MNDQKEADDFALFKRGMPEGGRQVPQGLHCIDPTLCSTDPGGAISDCPELKGRQSHVVSVQGLRYYDILYSAMSQLPSIHS